MEGQVLILDFYKEIPSLALLWRAEQQLVVEMEMGLPRKLLLWFLG